MSLFVTATGTEIGKTVVSALILARYAERTKLAYWKPIATGAVEGRDTLEVRRLCGHLVDVIDESYLFDPPVSPHLAARRARRRIDSERIVEELLHLALADKDRSLVIEGIGGVLVPVNDDGYLVADLAKDLHLPCVVVASSELGTINHTLLTLEALRARDIPIAGVVMNGPKNRDNRQAIEKFGDVVVVGELEPLQPLSQERLLAAAGSFDGKAVLEQYFV